MVNLSTATEILLFAERKEETIADG